MVRKIRETTSRYLPSGTNSIPTIEYKQQTSEKRVKTKAIKKAKRDAAATAPKNKSKHTKGGCRGGYRGKGTRKVASHDGDMNVVLAPSGFKGRRNIHRSSAAAAAAYEYMEQCYWNGVWDNPRHAYHIERRGWEAQEAAAAYSSLQALARDFASLECESIGGCAGVLSMYNDDDDEVRLDLEDGMLYPRSAFLTCYGAAEGKRLWNAADDEVRVDPSPDGCGMSVRRSTFVEDHGAAEGTRLWKEAGVRADRRGAPAAGVSIYYRFWSLQFHRSLNNCGNSKAVVYTKAAVYTALTAMASSGRARVDPEDGMQYPQSAARKATAAAAGDALAVGGVANKPAADGSAGGVCVVRPRLPSEIAVYILSFILRSEFGRSGRWSTGHYPTGIL